MAEIDKSLLNVKQDLNTTPQQQMQIDAESQASSQPEVMKNEDGDGH